MQCYLPWIRPTSLDADFDLQRALNVHASAGSPEPIVDTIPLAPNDFAGKIAHK